MPGKHDPEKRFVSFAVKRELLYMIDQLAESVGIDRTSYVVGVLQSDLKAKGVKLSAANKARVEMEVSEERKKRVAKWSGYTERVAKLRASKAAKNTAKKDTGSVKGAM